MTSFNRVIEFRRLSLFFILDCKSSLFFTNINNLIITVNDCGEGCSDCFSLSSQKMKCVFISFFRCLANFHIKLPCFKVWMNVHLTTWYKLKVTTALLNFLSMKESMTKGIHVAMIGKAPPVHPIFDYKIDVFLWITQTIKSRKPIMRMKGDEPTGRGQ